MIQSLKIEKGRGGFTLIEILTIIAISGILLAIAIPNFIGWQQKQRFKNALNDLHNALQMARVHAAREGVACTMLFTQTVDGEAYDYILFKDKRPLFEYGGDDEVIKKVKLEEYENVELGSVTFPDNGIAFRRNSLPRTKDPDSDGDNTWPGEIHLTNTHDNEDRWIEVSIAGNIVVRK